MKLPRFSIFRLMGSIALIASALGVLRAWAGVGWWLGELAPLTALGLFGLAFTLVTMGRVRRFFAGLATTGVVVGLVIWIAPISIREAIQNLSIVLIDDKLFNIDGDWLFYLPDQYFNIRPIRHPFCTHATQATLGLQELSVAVVGGLLTAIPRPRKTRPFVSTAS